MNEVNQKTSAITYLLGTIAMIASVGGASLALTARMLISRSGFPAWEAWPYLPWTFLVCGLVAGSLFGGFASVTHYLHGVRDYAKEITLELRLSNERPEASELADLPSAPEQQVD